MELETQKIIHIIHIIHTSTENLYRESSRSTNNLVNLDNFTQQSFQNSIFNPISSPFSPIQIQGETE